MPCIAVLIALIAPRLLIVLLWLLTDWFTAMFPSIVWPILGFIFLPTTLLWYSVVQNVWSGAWGLWQILGLALALAIDVSPARGRRGDD